MSHSENGSIMNDKDTNNRTSLQQNNGYRLCHIVKRPDFDGYGFNLHSEKSKPGQYIGKVDDKSPAEQSGLRQGDRIIEVNGYNIGNDTHKQVVQRIKAITNEVRLLVIDPIEYDKQQKQQKSSPTTTKTTITTTTTKIESDTNKNHNELEDNNNKTTTPTPTPTTAGSVSPTTSTRSQTNSINSASIKTDISTSTIIVGATNGHSMNSDATDSTNKLNNEKTTTITTTTNKITTDVMMSGGDISSTLQSNGNSANQQQQKQKSTTSSPSSSSGVGLNLPMTAAEMRAKLMAKKKYDPKNDSVDLRKKFEIIQKL